MGKRKEYRKIIKNYKEQKIVFQEEIGFEFFCDGKKYECSYTSGLKTR